MPASYVPEEVWTHAAEPPSTHLCLQIKILLTGSGPSVGLDRNPCFWKPSWTSWLLPSSGSVFFFPFVPSFCLWTHIFSLAINSKIPPYSSLCPWALCPPLHSTSAWHHSCRNIPLVVRRIHALCRLCTLNSQTHDVYGDPLVPFFHHIHLWERGG